MSAEAKAVRDKLCITVKCALDKGCGCLEAIDAALERHAAEIKRQREALEQIKELETLGDGELSTSGEIADRAALEYIRDVIAPGHGEPESGKYADEILTNTPPASHGVQK